MARRMRSGTGLGPGICRKCCPWVMSSSSPPRLFYNCIAFSPEPAKSPGKITLRDRRVIMVSIAQPGLERRLKALVAGDVLFDSFSRGRYATDASHYQMMPAGVVVPSTMDGAVAAMAIAREEGLAVTPRG